VRLLKTDFVILHALEAALPTEALWLAVNKAEMERSQVGGLCARWFPEGDDVG